MDPSIKLKPNFDLTLFASEPFFDNLEEGSAMESGADNSAICNNADDKDPFFENNVLFEYLSKKATQSKQLHAIPNFEKKKAVARNMAKNTAAPQPTTAAAPTTTAAMPTTTALPTEQAAPTTTAPPTEQAALPTEQAPTTTEQAAPTTEQAAITALPTEQAPTTTEQAAPTTEQAAITALPTEQAAPMPPTEQTTEQTTEPAPITALPTEQTAPPTTALVAQSEGLTMTGQIAPTMVDTINAIKAKVDSIPEGEVPAQKIMAKMNILTRDPDLADKVLNDDDRRTFESIVFPSPADFSKLKSRNLKYDIIKFAEGMGWPYEWPKKYASNANRPDPTIEQLSAIQFPNEDEDYSRLHRMYDEVYKNMYNMHFFGDIAPADQSHLQAIPKAANFLSYDSFVRASPETKKTVLLKAYEEGYVDKLKGDLDRERINNNMQLLGQLTDDEMNAYYKKISNLLEQYKRSSEADKKKLRGDMLNIMQQSDSATSTPASSNSVSTPIRSAMSTPSSSGQGQTQTQTQTQMVDTPDSGPGPMDPYGSVKRNLFKATGSAVKGVQNLAKNASQSASNAAYGVFKKGGEQKSKKKSIATKKQNKQQTKKKRHS